MGGSLSTTGDQCFPACGDEGNNEKNNGNGENHNHNHHEGNGDGNGNEIAASASEECEAEFQFQTAPFDPRFPNQNQTKYCYTSFLDYKRCIKLRGEDFPACEYYRKVYKSICPFSWVDKWEDQISNGIFPGKI